MAYIWKRLLIYNFINWALFPYVKINLNSNTTLIIRKYFNFVIKIEFINKTINFKEESINWRINQWISSVVLIADHFRLYNILYLKAYENIVVFIKFHLYSEIIQRFQRSGICPAWELTWDYKSGTHFFCYPSLILFSCFSAL